MTCTYPNCECMYSPDDCVFKHPVSIDKLLEKKRKIRMTEFTNETKLLKAGSSEDGAEDWVRKQYALEPVGEASIVEARVVADPTIERTQEAVNAPAVASTGDGGTEF